MKNKYSIFTDKIIFRYKNYLTRSFLESKSFNDIKKIVLKRGIINFAYSLFIFQLFTDVVLNIKNTPDIYNRYNTEDKQDVNKVLKLMYTNIDLLNMIIENFSKIIKIKF